MPAARPASAVLAAASAGALISLTTAAERRREQIGPPPLPAGGGSRRSQRPRRRCGSPELLSWATGLLLERLSFADLMDSVRSPKRPAPVIQCINRRRRTPGCQQAIQFRDSAVSPNRQLAEGESRFAQAGRCCHHFDF